MASGSGNRMTRDEFKKAKVIEEARKAGTLPAELDEEGHEINPHIPQYIAQAPWYLSTNAPSLKHQRKFQEEKDYDKAWYARGEKQGPAATKFRKGACTNCGAMTHKAKDCCERPRKIGAKYTGKDIQADEIVKDLDLDYDGTRDRWNGFDPDMYKDVEERYARIEEERRKKKADESKQQSVATESVEKSGADVSDDSDFDVSDTETTDQVDYVDKGDTVFGQKKDSKTRTTVRVLRIREDTAKYLRNLDPNSAYYDPKSRSMRDNPNPEKDSKDLTYAGDNFVRGQGQVNDFYEAQVFAWEASRRGQDVHLQGVPSQAELVYKDFQKKQQNLKNQQKDFILSKYGGEEHLVNPNTDSDIQQTILAAQSEVYVEYNRDGSLATGADSIPSSKYAEDIFINNHTCVWGSFFDQGKWGYLCCRQFVKNSFCIGKTGIDIHLQSKAALETPSSKASTLPTSISKPKDAEQEKKIRFEKALNEEDRRKNEEKDERKRSYNSSSADNYKVTDEEMEAYYMKKNRWEDPMAKPGFKSM